MQTKNLSDIEKDSQTVQILEPEEASIMKALESADIEKRLNKFTKEEEEQYRFVCKKLWRIVEEEVKYLYNSFQDLNTILQTGQSNSQLNQAERTYIKVIGKRSMGSTKIIQEKLKQVEASRNADKQLDKATQIKDKDKKAKKVSLDEEDIEDEE